MDCCTSFSFALKTVDVLFEYKRALPIDSPLASSVFPLLPQFSPTQTWYLSPSLREARGTLQKRMSQSATIQPTNLLRNIVYIL